MRACAPAVAFHLPPTLPQKLRSEEKQGRARLRELQDQIGRLDTESQVRAFFVDHVNSGLGQWTAGRERTQRLQCVAGHADLSSAKLPGFMLPLGLALHTCCAPCPRPTGGQHTPAGAGQPAQHHRRPGGGAALLGIAGLQAGCTLPLQLLMVAHGV